VDFVAFLLTFLQTCRQVERSMDILTMSHPVTCNSDVQACVTGSLGAEAKRGRTVDGCPLQSVALHLHAVHIDHRDCNTSACSRTTFVNFSSRHHAAESANFLTVAEPTTNSLNHCQYLYTPTPKQICLSSRRGSAFPQSAHCSFTITLKVVLKVAYFYHHHRRRHHLYWILIERSKQHEENTN